jgi:hypothetical protein
MMKESLGSGQQSGPNPDQLEESAVATYDPIPFLRS